MIIIVIIVIVVGIVIVIVVVVIIIIVIVIGIVLSSSSSSSSTSLVNNQMLVLIDYYYDQVCYNQFLLRGKNVLFYLNLPYHNFPAFFSKHLWGGQRKNALGTWLHLETLGAFDSSAMATQHDALAKNTREKAGLTIKNGDFRWT
jgi:CDP-diglyceride synthetase